MKTTTLYPLLAVLAMMVITPALDVNAMPQPTPQMPGTGNGGVARPPPGTVNGPLPDPSNGTGNRSLPDPSNGNVARPPPVADNRPPPVTDNRPPPVTDNRPPPVTDNRPPPVTERGTVTSPPPDLFSDTDTFADGPNQGTNGSNASVNKHDTDSTYQGTAKYPFDNGAPGPYGPAPTIYRHKSTDRRSGSLSARVAALEAEVQELRANMGPSSGSFIKPYGDMPSFDPYNNGNIDSTDPKFKHVVPARPFGGPLPQPKPAGDPYKFFSSSGTKAEPSDDSSGDFTTDSGVRVNVKPAVTDSTTRPKPNPQAANVEAGGRQNPSTGNLPGPTPNPGTQTSPIF